MKTLQRTALFALAILLAACNTADVQDGPYALSADEQALVRQGNVLLPFPEEDPGPPFYLRAAPLLDQFFHSDGWLAIPFYRDPGCVPADFNLLDVFDPPTGPNSPGAFACPLTVHGRLLIEADAPLGTFPRLVTSSGDAVPFWFVRWDAFQTALATGSVTIADLEAMDPLKGTARRFHETLRPRPDEHLVVINADGHLADGRRFSFHVTHVGDQTKSIRLAFR